MWLRDEASPDYALPRPRGLSRKKAVKRSMKRSDKTASTRLSRVYLARPIDVGEDACTYNARLLLHLPAATRCDGMVSGSLRDAQHWVMNTIRLCSLSPQYDFTTD